MVPPGWDVTLKGDNLILSDPASGMDFSSLPDDFFEKFTPEKQALELMWLFGAANITKTNNEIIIPSNVIDLLGYNVLYDLRGRLENLLGEPVIWLLDKTVDAYRIRPRGGVAFMPFSLKTHEYLSKMIHQAAANGIEIPREPPRVPRPPNSFILYRQHHNHAVTAANPGVQNTQISRIIANMWREETPETRNQFKELAEQKKKLHAQVYPNYHYTPRRPGEKLRRRPARIHTTFVPFIGSTTAGRNRIDEANNNTKGFIDVDGDFIDILADHGLVNGPNSLAPPPVFDNIRFENIVQEQLDRVALETVHFIPLQGNEFDESFPMDEMLGLDGA